MTKSELIDVIAARSELTKSRAELVVNAVFEAMTDALDRGEGIEIRGFGSFAVREYKSYSGRNPRTGEPVEVRAKRLPTFKVGKELKDLVNTGRLAFPAVNGAKSGSGSSAEGDDDDEK
jgi:integration host factor subunit beta